MFAIANGRKALWQWDLNQQLTVAGSCTEVHYLDKGALSTLTVAVKDGKADIPNILLQKAGRLVVYAYIIDAQDHHTKVCETFGIAPRPKPTEYVYTETEVKTWSDLQSQIGDLDNLVTEKKNNLVAAINEAAQSGGGGADISLGLTSAAVGQTIKVKAVDESGKPTEWEAADMPSGGGGGSSVGSYKFIQTVTIPDGENVSIVDITIPAKTRKLYVLGGTNTSSTFGTTVRTYIRNGNVALAALNIDSNMSHRNALFVAELYDDIQFMSFSSSNAVFGISYPGYATFKDYASYFAKENNFFRIMIISEKSTNQYFAAGCTFSLYAACEE